MRSNSRMWWQVLQQQQQQVMHRVLLQTLHL
jgi:hypothetical protein